VVVMGIEVLAATFVFVAVSALTLALLRGGSSRHMAEQRIQDLGRAPLEAQPEARGLLTRTGTQVPFLRNLTASDGGWAASTALDLQRAGLTLKVSEYLLARLLFGVLAAVFVFLVTSASPLGILIALLVGAVFTWLPSLFLRSLVSRRQNALSGQLVETLQLISNALRSGFAFTQAIELASKQIEPPMKDELGYFLRDNSLGAPIEDSLRAMVERSGSLDLDMMVTTILVQRTTGGNLSEILDNVGETIRERYRLKGEMRALTASQRLTGLILSIYPAALFGLFFLVAPSVMKVLVTDEVGIVLLAIALTLQGIGAFTIRRITNLEV
jgi:tight adherence protein B